jgi:leucyl aminopeptidase (aminopeptidase T)
MTPTRARVTMMLAAVVLVMAVPASAQPKDPFVGTWRLDVAKSKYSPGPAPKSQTVTCEASGQGYRITVKSEPASGAAQQWSFTTALDGKDVPLTGNNPNVDMLAAKRIDANTLESVNKKGGKVVATQRNVVSADGKTWTVTTTGTDGQGQKVNNVAVLVKQ